MTDAELARFHAGDERVFAALVREHSPRMAALVRRLGAPPEDAADALQDAWLRAFDRRLEYRRAGSLVGWLLAIARSAAVDQRRRARVRPTFAALSLDAGEPEGMPSVPADDGERAGEGRRAVEAVLDLPPQQREVVMHRLIEERSTRETALALGCAEGTVKATLFQALRSLRRRLEESPETGRR